MKASITTTWSARAVARSMNSSMKASNCGKMKSPPNAVSCCTNMRCRYMALVPTARPKKFLLVRSERARRHAIWQAKACHASIFHALLTHFTAAGNQAVIFSGYHGDIAFLPVALQLRQRGTDRYVKVAACGVQRLSSASSPLSLFRGGRPVHRHRVGAGRRQQFRRAGAVHGTARHDELARDGAAAADRLDQP